MRALGALCSRSRTGSTPSWTTTRLPTLSVFNLLLLLLLLLLFLPLAAIVRLTYTIVVCSIVWSHHGLVKITRSVVCRCTDSNLYARGLCGLGVGGKNGQTTVKVVKPTMLVKFVDMLHSAMYSWSKHNGQFILTRKTRKIKILIVGWRRQVLVLGDGQVLEYGPPQVTRILSPSAAVSPVLHLRNRDALEGRGGRKSRSGSG